jgi:hypothetical protein
MNENPIKRKKNKFETTLDLYYLSTYIGYKNE